MNNINYSNIETISDQVMMLSLDTYLKMNVKLGYKDKDNNRQSYMRGYVVPGMKYNTSPDVLSIKRSFDYYLSIEKYQNQDFYIQIRPSKMIIMRHILNETAKWILSNDIWAIKDNKLILKGRPNPININGMQPNNRTLQFEPIVNEYNGVYDKGIRMTIFNIDNYVDIGSDTFMGFVYTINNIDLYTAAITILNSVPIYSEPQFVKQLVTIDSEYNIEDTKKNEGIIKATPNRKIGDNNSIKSFFDN